MKKTQIVKFISLIMAIIFIGTGCTQKLQESNQNIETDISVETSQPEEVLEDYQTIFAKDVVHTIDISISDEAWTALLANPEEEVYHEANITVDGVTAEKVGLRTKGNSSLKSVASSESERYSFKIKLDEYVEDQALLGLDEFVLNNMFSDASYMREYLSYKIMGEAGLDVPLASYVEVSINGEPFGLYLMVEAIEDSYLKRAFGENAGNLYKQEVGSSLVYEENQGYKSSEQKKGEDESKSDLANFIKILNEMPDGEKGDIESVLDVESALKYIAANTVLENYDSYSGPLAQNYYLYNNGDKFTVIPWDFNMAFGGFQGGALSTIDIDEPISGTTLDKVPLIQNLLEVDAYKAQYYEIIEEYLDVLEDFETEVADLATLIRPSIEADPTKFVTIEQFDMTTQFQIDGPDEANAEGGFGKMGGNFGNMNGEMPTNGQMPPNGQMPTDGQMPIDGQRPIDGQMPIEGGGFPAGEGVVGERPERGEFANGGMRGGDMKGGMSLTGSTSSLINIMRARIANLQTQLTE